MYTQQEEDVLSKISMVTRQLDDLTKQLGEIRENKLFARQGESEWRRAMAEAREKFIQGMDKVMGKPADCPDQTVQGKETVSV